MKLGILLLLLLFGNFTVFADVYSDVSDLWADVPSDPWDMVMLKKQACSRVSYKHANDISDLRGEVFNIKNTNGKSKYTSFGQVYKDIKCNETGEYDENDKSSNKYSLLEIAIIKDRGLDVIHALLLSLKGGQRNLCKNWNSDNGPMPNLLREALLEKVQYKLYKDQGYTTIADLIKRKRGKLDENDTEERYLYETQWYLVDNGLSDATVSPIK